MEVQQFDVRGAAEKLVIGEVLDLRLEPAGGGAGAVNRAMLMSAAATRTRAGTAASTRSGVGPAVRICCRTRLVASRPNAVAARRPAGVGEVPIPWPVLAGLLRSLPSRQSCRP
ncbi:hypothetical protein GCM10009734_97610 [Nonomuraea bangladeshensis]